MCELVKKKMKKAVLIRPGPWEAQQQSDSIVLHECVCACVCVCKRFFVV